MELWQQCWKRRPRGGRIWLPGKRTQRRMRSGKARTVAGRWGRRNSSKHWKRQAFTGELAELTMPDNKPPQTSIILYQTEDGRARIQCRFENETIWLTQALMAELFQTTAQNVTLHLKAIFAEGELVEAATCKDYLQVRREGMRE